MKILIFIIIFVSFILSIVIVNKVQQLYMKLIGAEVMFFNAKKKLIAIAVIGLFIAACILQLFGLDQYLR